MSFVLLEWLQLKTTEKVPPLTLLIYASLRVAIYTNHVGCSYLVYSSAQTF